MQAASVRNHVKLGVSLRVLYCVVDTGYGFSFPLRFDGGMLEFVMQDFGDSLKLSSSAVG